MIQVTVNDEIDRKIKELVQLKQSQKSKNWIPGKDWVQYSGSYFDDDEYIAGIECFLNGWLALGENGIATEFTFNDGLFAVSTNHSFIPKLESNLNMNRFALLGS